MIVIVLCFSGLCDYVLCCSGCTLQRLQRLQGAGEAGLQMQRG